MADVFLSYSSADRAIVRRYAEALAETGLSVWWDNHLHAGEAFDEMIEKALREAKAVVVLWSKNSVVSRWVRAEATLADRQRKLTPVMIEACERPIMFELTQTADLSGWEGQTEDSRWRGFLEDVRRTIAQNPGAAAAAPVAAPPPKRSRPSIAIMPFANRSGLAEDEAFALGMVEDIGAALVLNPTVKVIASGATAPYRKAAVDLRQVGRELEARYVLEGNIRRVGETLRVSSQLVEAETGAILWTQIFDRPLSELAALQEDLVQEVAAHLGVQITRAEMQQALRKPGDVSAYEAVYRSHAAYSKNSLKNAFTAVAEARRAVAIAPDYPQAHAALALALSALYAWGDKDEAVADEAAAGAERAVELAPNHASVLASAGWVYCMIRRAGDGLAYAERAVEVAPNLERAQSALGLASYYLNHPGPAVEHMAAAEKLSPRGYTQYLTVSILAAALLQAGRAEDALATVDRSLALSPNYPITHLRKLCICAVLGRDTEFDDTVRRLRKAEPDTPLAVHQRRLAEFLVPIPGPEVTERLEQTWAATA